MAALPIRLWRRAETAVRAESALVMLLAASFIARWLLADRRSYWYDEFLSVDVYGVWNSSASGAVQNLAENSIHPPLYQLVLYYWMEAFGDSERATRTLSNIDITLAALFLYLLMRDAFSRRVALASAVVFSLLYSPTYYAMESRSYAQSMFLATLSSYALLHLARVVPERTWRRSLLSPTAVMFTLANIGLLLTHYYNFFFCAAQAVLVILFVLRERPARVWLAELSLVAGAYLLQVAFFALVWGRVFVASYRKSSGSFTVEGGVRSPYDLLMLLVRPNIAGSDIIYWLLLAGGIVLFAHVAVVLIRSGSLDSTRRRAWTTLYLVGWVMVPLLVTVVVFEIAGVARYSERYWLFIVPPFAPLLVLVIRKVVLLGVLGLRQLGRFGTAELGSVVALITTVALVGASVLPGTRTGATEMKEDWRGIVQDIVDMVQADDDNEYIIYEASPRSVPFSNRYFEEFSPSIRARGVVQRSGERSGTFRVLTDDETEVSDHDYLVIIFGHDRARTYPNLIEQLDERYELHSRHLSPGGRGYIVYKIHPAN